jgi:molybdenum cofactor cytidylyltransferase
MVKKNITALVLAAGLSRRMGEPKILMQIAGYPIIYWVLDSLIKTKIANISIVLGHRYQDVIAYLKVFKVFNQIDIIINHNYKKGIGSSISLGISSLDQSCEATCIFLADMPFIEDSVISTLINTYCSLENREAIVVPRYKGKNGHPVFFSSFYFTHLKELNDDFGAKYLLKKYEKNITTVTIKSSSILTDIDTKNEYKKWIK